MGEVVNWLLRISWADLVIGTAAGFGAAMMLTMLTLYLHGKRSGLAGNAEHDGINEHKRLLLYCGDVKALTDLAIQRHMSDVAFLQRFRAQPCYEILAPHFSDDVRQRLAQARGHDGHADLAAACRAECERLEQLWQAS